MTYKTIGTIGLLFLIISQILFTMGFDFLITLTPFDFAHWFMLLGAIMVISLSFVFPESRIKKIATVIMIIGITAHIGMCMIDFSLWNFGTNIEGRNELVGQLMNTPSIWIPFIIAGPPFLFIGLSFQAWALIKTHTYRALITLMGSLIFGIGQIAFNDIIVVLVGFIIFSIGLILLAYRKESPSNSAMISKEDTMMPILE